MHIQQILQQKKLKPTTQFYKGKKKPSTFKLSLKDERALKHKRLLLSRPRKKKRRSVFTAHNKRKLSVLIAVFNSWKSAGQVALETLVSHEQPYADVHRRNVAKCLSRLKYGYTHPYVSLGIRKKGASVVYRCTKKGRKIACELNYCDKNGLSLKWKKPGYHVECAHTCDMCVYNPT